MNDIVLGILGGELYADMSFISYFRETVIYLSGGGVNLILSLLCVLFLQRGFNIHIFFFCFSNLFYALLNLLPIKTLDGRHILECLLCMITDPVIAFRICDFISKIFTVLLCVLSVTVIGKIGVNITLWLIHFEIICQCILSKPCCLKAS